MLAVLMFSREILWVKQLLLPLLRHTSDSGCVCVKQRCSLRIKQSFLQRQDFT